MHKANIMKKADGLFLESTQEVAKQFPTVEYEVIVITHSPAKLRQLSLWFNFRR